MLADGGLVFFADKVERRNMTGLMEEDI